MLMWRLGSSPEIKAYHEHDDVAFDNFKLRDEDTVQRLLSRSPFPFVVFKPLVETDRIRCFMSAFGPAKAIWVYRRAEDRANSSLAKFGPGSLKVFGRIARGGWPDTWGAQAMTDEDRKLIQSFDYTDMSAGEAAALFWYVRNQIFFREKLDTDKDVWLVSYEAFVSEPEADMRRLCRFLGCRYYPSMVRGIHARSIARQEAPRISERTREMCSILYERFDRVRANKENNVC